MPPYALSKGDYIWGYFLWILLALMIPVVIAKAIKSRRYRVQQQQAGASQTGPLTIKTEEDRFIAAQVALQLRPRERVSHQACVRSDVVVGALVTLGAKAHFAVLTDQRLLLIETRTSLFGVRLENRGIESIERSAIKAVLAGPDGALGIALNDGTTRVLVVDPKRRRFSNQSAFLLDLPRLFPAAEVAAAGTTAAAPS